MAEEQYFDKLALMVKDEDDYGVSAGPTSTANAILAQNVRIKPMAAEQIERKFYRNFWGGRPNRAPASTSPSITRSRRRGPARRARRRPTARSCAWGRWPRCWSPGWRARRDHRLPAAAATGRFTYAKTTKFSGSYRASPP